MQSTMINTETTANLKQRTIKGLLWSFADVAAGQGIQFFVSIILARLLLPREFGLMGMIVVFIAVSEAFVNSGFSSALIRKKNATQADYSTVFFFSLAVAILFFIGLFFSAPAISTFFNEPALIPVVKVLGLVLVIDALTMIHRTTLTRNIDFKLLSRISFIASTGSGVLAIVMAYTGWGVWSLVAQRLGRQLINSVLLIIWARWMPQLVFSMKSFRELFGFGSKLLASSLIDNIYNNINSLLIGRYFSAVSLGFYNRADEFNRLPSQNMSGIIGRVSYPVLCSVQDDNNRLRDVYRKFIRNTMFITFILMMVMAAAAEPMIISLIGEKWRDSVVYFQMLAFTGMFYPLHVLNLNILQVKGRSDLFLKLEIIKKVLAVPAIVLGVIFGIKVMIAGMMLNTLVDFYLNNHWSRKMIGYSFMEQVRDIMPSFILGIAVAAGVFVIGTLSPFSLGSTLILQLTGGILLTILISETTRHRDYLYIKDIVRTELISIPVPVFFRKTRIVAVTNEEITRK